MHKYSQTLVELCFQLQNYCFVKWKPFFYVILFFCRDTKRCLRYLVFWGNHHHFVFIGDVRNRILYETFVTHLQVFSSAATNAEDNKSIIYHYNEPIINQEYTDYKLKLRVNFIYAPDLAPMIAEFTRWQNIQDPPSFIVASTTQAQFLHGNITNEMIKSYSMNLSQLLQPIDTLTREKKVKILWKLQDPVDEDKLSEEWRNVQNDHIDRYNDAAYSILKYSGAQIWSSSNHIASGLLDEAIDGWHLSKLAAQHDIQTLLNMYCNDYMNFNDGTCCSSAEPYTILQIITYALFGVR